MGKPELYYNNPFIRQLNQKPQTCFGTVVKIDNYTRLVGEGLDFGSEDLTYQLGAYIDERDKNMFGGKLATERAIPHKDPRVGFLLENFDNPEVKQKLMAYLGSEVQVIRPSDIRSEDTWRYVHENLNGRYSPRALSKLELGVIQEICRQDEIVATEFLKDNIKNGNRTLMNFRYEPLTGRRDGHYVFVAVVKEFKDDDGNHISTDISVADPSPFNPDYWTSDLRTFLYSMMPLWDEGKEKRERGFVVFSGPNHRKQDNPQRIEEFISTIPHYIPSITRIRREKPHPETHLSLKSVKKVV